MSVVPSVGVPCTGSWQTHIFSMNLRAAGLMHSPAAPLNTPRDSSYRQRANDTAEAQSRPRPHTCGTTPTNCCTRPSPSTVLRGWEGEQCSLCREEVISATARRALCRSQGSEVTTSGSRLGRTGCRVRDQVSRVLV